MAPKGAPESFGDVGMLLGINCAGGYTTVAFVKMHRATHSKGWMSLYASISMALTKREKNWVPAPPQRDAALQEEGP